MFNVLLRSSAAVFSSAISGRVDGIVPQPSPPGWSAAKFIGAVRLSNSCLDAAEGGGNGLWQFWSAFREYLEHRNAVAWATLVGEGVLGEVMRVNIERHDLFDARH